MILATQSPRRIQLIEEAGYSVRVMPADIDETPREGETPFALVERLARAKAAALAPQAEPGEIIVAADTTVTFNGDILGKPRDAQDARRMLRELSGRTHQVATGACVLKAAEPEVYCAAVSESFVTVTDVTFYELTDAEIDAYVATGDPLDKAGAYGIQSAGGRMLVKGIKGDYYNVVGLPIAAVARKIEALSR